MKNKKGCQEQGSEKLNGKSEKIIYKYFAKFVYETIRIILFQIISF